MAKCKRELWNILNERKGSVYVGTTNGHTPSLPSNVPYFCDREGVPLSRFPHPLRPIAESGVVNRDTGNVIELEEGRTYRVRLTGFDDTAMYPNVSGEMRYHGDFVPIVLRVDKRTKIQG